MRHASRIVICGFSVCALLFVVSPASQAGTIIKLDLGNVGPDVGLGPLGPPYNLAPGSLSTIDDGNPATTGDQNTAIVYTGFLSPLPNVTIPPGPPASFTLTGLQEVTLPPATVVPPLVIQNFTGGSFSLYDPSNVLLLQGPLTSSALTGVTGPPGTGALFTTTLETVTGGTLAQYIAPGSVSLSMNLTNVNGGNGFSVVAGPNGPIVSSFLADAAISISADPSGIGPGVPEPASLMLVLGGAFAVVCGWRRRGR